MKKKKKKIGEKKIGVAEPPHRGWLAALWAMGVVRPPPDRPIWGWPNHWPKGWPATPMGVVRPPLFFFLFFFFLILIYFIFKIKFLKNNILLVKNGAF
jgi:hypothetical protein